MIDVRDRVPENPNQFQIKKADGSTEIVTITRADNPTVEGTPINRAVLMDMQGFFNGTTTTDVNTVTTNYDNGNVAVTTVSDGKIVSELTGSSGSVIRRTTTIAENGITTLSEELS